MWKLANVPVPPQHLLGLISGVILQLVFKQRLLPVPWVGDAIGLPLVTAGVSLGAWSVLAAGDTEVDAPDKLLTGGPYSVSRNPMYLAWTLLYLGTGLAANSLWITALLPVVAAYTHFVDVRREERFLAEQFGDEYLQYKENVRRYL